MMSGLLLKILPYGVALATLAFTVVHTLLVRKDRDTKVAQANAQVADAKAQAATARADVADVQNATAQTNAVAAQQTATAAQERTNVENDVSALSADAAMQRMRDLGFASPGAAVAGSGAAEGNRGS
jgi:hypothetical protein